MASIDTYEASAPMTAGAFFRLLARRSWVILLVMATALAGTYYVTKHTTPEWTATAQMIMVPKNTGMIGSPDMTALAMAPESVDTQITMLQSQAMLRRTLDWIRFGVPPEQATRYAGLSVTDRELGADLNVSNPKLTEIIEIAVTANSRDRAQLLGNAVAQAFVAWKKEIAQDDFDVALASLRRRAARTKVVLERANAELAAFKASHGSINPPLTMDAHFKQYLALEDALAKEQNQLQSTEGRAADLEGRLNRMNHALVSGSQIRSDTLVSQMQDQLASLESKRAEEAQKYTSKYPGILPNLDAQIASTRARLHSTIQAIVGKKLPSLGEQDLLHSDYVKAESDIAYQRAALSALQHTRDTIGANLTADSRLAGAYSGLADAARYAKSLYDQTNSALASLTVSRDSATANVQITQDAYSPVEPSQPQPLRNYLFGTLIGVLLSFLVVMLLEQADQRIRSTSQLRSMLPGPIIGALPKLRGRQLQALEAGQSADFNSETYSLARANLALALRSALPPDAGAAPIVLVTSALPGEGKSLTAASIARSAARAGKRVVLVNADMRNPSMGDLFNTSEPTGLADVLSGRMTVESAIVSSDTENLTVLHSGSPDRNPSDLLSRREMGDMLTRLRQVSDLIVIDTPPCALVADALVIAPAVDCILQVVSLGMGDPATILDTVAALRSAEPRALVFFVNRSQEEKKSSYHLYYSYQRHETNGRNGGSGGAKSLPALSPPLQADEPSKEGETHDAV